MWLFDIFKGSSKAVDVAAGIAEKAASGIDKIFFTEEEKTEARQKFFDTWLSLQNIIATEGTATAISRRILAFMIMGTFLGLIVLGVLAYAVSADWSKVIFAAVDRLDTLAAAVGATYFIKDLVVKAIQAKK